MTPQDMFFAFFINAGCFTGFIVAMFFFLGILVKNGYFDYYEYDSVHAESRMKDRIIRARERDGWVLVAIYQDAEKGNQLAMQFKKKFTRLPWGPGGRDAANQ